MNSIRKLLNQIWSSFRLVGITDNIIIIEYIGALLLSNEPSLSPDDEQWPRESKHPNLDVTSIKQKLAEAAIEADKLADENVSGAALLFDSYLLFRLSEMLVGGRYPTPRHIVKSIVRLAEVKPTHHVADLACGSGGFLVHSVLDAPPKSVTGVEISPEWARLARTNLILQGYLQGDRAANIITGNAFRVAVPLLGDKTFDRILMNPSFNERVDAALAKKAVGYEVGSRSETALVALALTKLAKNGRAAILVSSSVLRGSSTGEQELRRQLVEDYELEAVFSFPKDAFQPFSSLQTHLLLVRANKPNGQKPIWFFRVERDGYPSGRGRDLTIPPRREASDLPFVEDVFINRELFDEVFPKDGKALIKIRRSFSENANLLGVVIKFEQTATNCVVERFPATANSPSFVLAEVTTTNQQRLSVQILLDDNQKHVLRLRRIKDEVTGEIAGTLKEVNRSNLLQELYRPKKNDPSPGTVVLQEISGGHSIALSHQGKLLGLTVAAVRKPSYDLRPDQYIKRREEVHPVYSPAMLLTNIRRNQRQFVLHLDALLGRLSIPVAGGVLPSPLLSEIEPFGTLSAEQKAVWEQVRQQIKPIGDKKWTAELFTLAQIEGLPEVRENTKLTIELLERMGVIVPVTVTEPRTGEQVAFYRRVTERDVWHVEAEEAHEGENS